MFKCFWPTAKVILRGDFDPTSLKLLNWFWWNLNLRTIPRRLLACNICARSDDEGGLGNTQFETSAPIPTKFCTVTKTTMLFVGGLISRKTNSRWGDRPLSWEIEKWPYIGLNDRHETWHGDWWCILALRTVPAVKISNSIVSVQIACSFTVVWNTSQTSGALRSVI